MLRKSDEYLNNDCEKFSDLGLKLIFSINFLRYNLEKRVILFNEPIYSFYSIIKSIFATKKFWRIERIVNSAQLEYNNKFQHFPKFLP